MRIAASVALGTGLGAMVRVGMDAVIEALLGSQFPIGILTVNILGSLFIGFLATLTAPEGRFLIGPFARQFLLAGLCGGFTTFSFFSLQTMQLLNDGRLSAALLYASLTLVLCMVAVWLGHAAGLRVNRLNHQPGNV